MRRANLYFLPFILALLLGDVSFAGTGGSELASLWDEIVQGLQGYWGKIIAVALLGFAILMGVRANWLMAFALLVISFSIGIIPGVIDTRYTLTF